MQLEHGNNVSLRCLGDHPGPRFLDGRTHDSTVGLAPERQEPFTGTKWQVVGAGNGIIALKYLGHLDGPRWLDGRTHNGTAGLAQRPTRHLPGQDGKFRHIL